MRSYTPEPPFTAIQSSSRRHRRRVSSKEAFSAHKRQRLYLLFWTDTSVSVRLLTELISKPSVFLAEELPTLILTPVIVRPSALVI